MTTETSKTFYILQFPLAALVMVNHDVPGVDPHDLSRYLNLFLGNALAFSTVLNVYFLMSGYLLFTGMERYTFSWHARKLKGRAKSLLLPYMIWLIIPCLLSLLTDRPRFPQMTLESIERYFLSRGTQSTWSPLGYIFETWHMPEANYVLWTVRDIMLLMLLAPAIVLLVKTLKKWIFPLLAAVIILNPGLPGLGSAGPCWFTCGAALAMLHVDFITLCRSKAKVLTVVWLSLCLIHACYCNYKFGLPYLMIRWFNLLNSLTGIIGVCAMFGIAGCIVRNADKGKTRLYDALVLLSPAAFFIFVTHAMPLLMDYYDFTDPLVTDPRWRRDVAWLAFYLARLIGLTAIFFMLRACFPRLTDILTGGRAHQRHTCCLRRNSRQKVCGNV